MVDRVLRWAENKLGFFLFSCIVHYSNALLVSQKSNLESVLVQPGEVSVLIVIVY